MVKEQEYISIGSQHDTNRRLYIDLKAQRDGQLVLIEIKGLERSPVHELMELLGQYLIYQLALEYLSIDIPLYMAVPQVAYQNIIQHVSQFLWTVRIGAAAMGTGSYFFRRKPIHDLIPSAPVTV